MTTFHCIPMPTETAERFRHTGLDDSGNTLRRMVATAEGGFPCRHCLQLGLPGETMLLGSYDLPRPPGHPLDAQPGVRPCGRLPPLRCCEQHRAHHHRKRPGVGARL